MGGLTKLFDEPGIVSPEAYAWEARLNDLRSIKRRYELDEEFMGPNYLAHEEDRLIRDEYEGDPCLTYARRKATQNHASLRRAKPHQQEWPVDLRLDKSKYISASIKHVDPEILGRTPVGRERPPRPPPILDPMRASESFEMRGARASYLEAVTPIATAAPTTRGAPTPSALAAMMVGDKPRPPPGLAPFLDPQAETPTPPLRNVIPDTEGTPDTRLPRRPPLPAETRGGDGGVSAKDVTRRVTFAHHDQRNSATPKSHPAQKYKGFDLTQPPLDEYRSRPTVGVRPPPKTQCFWGHTTTPSRWRSGTGLPMGLVPGLGEGHQEHIERQRHHRARVAGLNRAAHRGEDFDKYM